MIVRRIEEVASRRLAVKFSDDSDSGARPPRGGTGPEPTAEQMDSLLTRTPLTTLDEVQLLDTTLRDGEQMPGVSLTPAEKVDIARELDAAGMHLIEAGSACTSEGEREAIRRVADEGLDATVTSFARGVKADIDHALDCGVDGINLVVPASDKHVETKVGSTRDAVVERTVGYAASDIELIAENAARAALEDEAPIAERHLNTALDETPSSIEDWVGVSHEQGTHIVQPEGVDLSAGSLVDPGIDRTFEDVGGMSELKARLRETVVDPLERPEAYEEYGLDVLTGLLLYGPPGCGKTYLAGALTGEVGHAFVEVSPADLASKWMGEPAGNVADLFAVARANAPCVLFLDEIDAIAGSRGGMRTSQQQMVNQLLTELEGIGDEDVVVVGATNLLEDVDPAIRRSGRFDERVEVPPPDAEARREILQVHLADRPVADDVDWGPVVAGTEGYAASDVELLAENAARNAFQEGTAIADEHFDTALFETQSSLRTWDDGERYARSDTSSDLRHLG